MMIDECVTFLIASTQTTSVMLYNALYYLICNQEQRQKCTDDINQLLTEVHDPSEKEINWVEVLKYENLQTLKYITYCI